MLGRSTDRECGVVEDLCFLSGRTLARVRPPANESTLQVHLFLQSESADGDSTTWVQIESLSREATEPDGLELWTAKFHPLSDRCYMARARFESHVSNCQIAQA